MTTIGTFARRPDGTYEGRLTTLTMRAAVRLVPNEAKGSDKEPDYRAFAGRAELGAAWARESREGVPYLSVALDDPSFAAPIDAALLPAEADPERFALVWSRQRRG